MKPYEGNGEADSNSPRQGGRYEQTEMDKQIDMKR